KLIDKSLIFDIAKMAKVDVEAVKKLDEHPDPFFTRVSRLFWGGGAGRGAPYHLANREDTFHVFLYAPREFKINRVRQYCTSHPHAERVIDTADRERAAFIHQHFRIHWPERHVYHMMLNTVVGEDAVVDLIVSAIGTVQTE